MRDFMVRGAMEAEEQEQLITIRGSISTVFSDAINAALNENASREDQNEIAQIVAMESAAQDVSIVNALVSKINQGFSMNTDPTKQPIGTGKILVDVIDAADPQGDELSESINTLDQIDRGEVEPENYVPVVVLDSELKPAPVLTGFESMCAKVGVKVHYMARVKQK